MSNLVESLLNCVHEEFLADVDPLMLAQALFNDDVIDGSFMDELTEMSLVGSSKDLIGRRMIQCLPYYCSSSQLSNALCKTGNQSLAKRMNRIAESQNIKCIRSITVDAGVTKKNIRLFFRELKNCIYSCKLEDPKKSLRKMALVYDKKMRLERLSRTRQYLADKLTMILAVELDAPIEEDELFIHLPSSEEQLNRCLIINQMKDLVSETSNPLITNMILFTRVSIENAMQGKFEEGETDLKMALQNACQTNPCLEKADMYYRIVHFYHRKFEHYPSDETRKSLMTFAEIGLGMLGQEADVVQCQWRVLFCIRMIFGQLCMSTECRIIPLNVSIAGIEKSKQLLAIIEESWEGITNKTKLLYYMAKARLSEVTNDIPMAVHYTKKTKQIALENRSKHFKYINEYLCFLASGGATGFGSTAVCDADDLDSSENTSGAKFVYHTISTEESKSITFLKCNNPRILHETEGVVVKSRITTAENCYTIDGVTYISTALGLGTNSSAEQKCITYSWRNGEQDWKLYLHKQCPVEGDTNSICSSETFSFDDDLLFGDGH
ncbi:hypothetical protein CHS0354_034839 [Potamilus streckersoni]|uniref:Uncharacterized protein n=1 Tax=Potamilus streckersoni TaxID=2493646 RepID=A0AAE0TJA8_9BIVA|nr:hypothetical protein CHS0354_034839 [Potamilus streckersoni]